MKIESILDYVEEVAHGLSNFGRATAHLEVTRSKFEELRQELYDEYENVAITEEKIANQLCHSYSLALEV